MLRRLFLKEKWKEVFVDELFDPSQTDLKKSISVAFGIFMGILPIWGFQLVAAIFIAVLLNLNKGLVIVFANISIPPMIPLIIYASYRFGAFWMPADAHPVSLTKSLSLSAIRYNFKQYLAGSISLAIIAGLVAGLITLYCSEYSAKKTGIRLTMAKPFLYIYNYFATNRKIFFTVFIGLFLITGFFALKIKPEEDISKILPKDARRKN